MEKKDVMATSFPMSGGDGIHSYARNSSYQRSTIDCSKENTREAISTIIDFQNPNFSHNIFRIADFGCSTGPNTFEVIQHIIDTVNQKHKRENDLEFHVFFNDLSNNDFNTLFKILPGNRNYFIAGVPGSFYGRLFPRESLHIGHTSNTLHWLSRAPEDKVGSLNSRVYKEQFEKDMRVFLEARAEELVAGGLMIILGQCLSEGVSFDRTCKGVIINMFLGCLVDLAKSGAASEEEVKSFIPPTYFPHFGELKEVMEKDGNFSIAMMEEIDYTMTDVAAVDLNELILSSCRAIYHGALLQCFGLRFCDELFNLFATKLIENPIDLTRYEKDMQYVVVLKRNVL